MPKPVPRQQAAETIRLAGQNRNRQEFLRLDKNENLSGIPDEHLQAVLDQITPAQLASYPEPHALYEKLAAHHGLSPDRVLVAHGSELAIRYAFEAYLSIGDEVVIANPSFAMFEVYAKLCGARIQSVDYQPDLTLDVNEVYSRIGSNTKVVALANPNNPTGTVLSNADLCSLCDTALKQGALMLVDEAYFHFYGVSMAEHLDRFENLVITRTFSKAYGLASVRLGYALGDSEVIGTIGKLQPIDHANLFAFSFGEYFLDHPEILSEYVDATADAKTYLEAALQRLQVRYVPCVGNFILLDLGDRRDWIRARLEDQGVLLGGDLRLPFANGFVRATVGPRDKMERFVRALEDCVHVTPTIAEN